MELAILESLASMLQYIPNTPMFSFSGNCVCMNNNRHWKEQNHVQVPY